MRRWSIVIILCCILLVGTRPVLGESYMGPISEMSKVQIKMEGQCNEEGCAEGYIWDNTVYVPVRFVMETMGAQIKWDDKNKMVSIVTSKIEDTTPTDAEDKVKTTTAIMEEKYRSTTEIIHRKAEVAVDQLITFNGLLDTAYDLYEATGEQNWVDQVSQGKVKELKNAMGELNQELLAYNDEYSIKHKQQEHYSQLAKKVVDASSFYEMSSQALSRYIENGNSGDKKTFLLYRFFALEQINTISEDLLEVQIQQKSHNQ